MKAKIFCGYAGYLPKHGMKRFPYPIWIRAPFSRDATVNKKQGRCHVIGDKPVIKTVKIMWNICCHNIKYSCLYGDEKMFYFKCKKIYILINNFNISSVN